VKTMKTCWKRIEISLINLMIKRNSTQRSLKNLCLRERSLKEQMEHKNRLKSRVGETAELLMSIDLQVKALTFRFRMASKMRKGILMTRGKITFPYLLYLIKKKQEQFQKQIWKKWFFRLRKILLTRILWLRSYFKQNAHKKM